MRLTLDKKWTDRLLQLPESGMGYQRVRVRLKDGRTIEDAVALNGQILLISDEVKGFDAADITHIELVIPSRP